MENGPFIDDFHIKTSIYKGFSMAMLNNQMVIADCVQWPAGRGMHRIPHVLEQILLRLFRIVTKLIPSWFAISTRPKR